MANKVLITQGTQPFAQRVARQLQEGCLIAFGAADEMPDVLLRSGNYVNLPNIKSPAYVHGMLKVCLDLQVNILIPLGKHELGRLVEVKALFKEYGIEVLSPEQQVMEALVIIENPPSQLPVVIVQDGRVLNGAVAGPIDVRLSGVFMRSDSGEDMALCCIAD